MKGGSCKIFRCIRPHSYYTILKAALDQKGFLPNQDHTLVLLGDAFDRGPETIELANFLPSLYGQGQLVYIRGNHEDLLERCILQLARGDSPYGIASSYHATNGTWDTLLTLAGM